MPRSFRWSVFFRFSHQTSLCISLISHAFHMPRADLIAAVEMCTDSEAIHAVFTIFLLNPTCWVQIFSLAPVLQYPQSVLYPRCKIPVGKMIFNFNF
jgi:hypothetical protein